MAEMEEETLLPDSSANSEGGLEEARAAEAVPSSSFISTVSSGAKKTTKSLSKTGKIQRALPLLLIGIVIIGGLLISFLSTTMMPFAVVNRMIEEFNTVGASSVIRSDNLLDLQLSMNAGDLSLSATQRASLKEQGIEPVAYGPGYILVFQYPNGKYGVVASTGMLEDSGVIAAAKEAVAARGENQKKIEFVSSALSTEEAMRDQAFLTPFTTASKYWRGGVAGWYDSLASLSSKVHGVTRSRWASYAASAANRTVSGFAKIAATSLSDASSTSAEINLTGPNGEELMTNDDGSFALDENGNYLDAETGESISSSSVSSRTNSVTSSALDKAVLAQKFISGAKVATDVLCAGVNGFIAVETMISTYNRLNGMNATSGFVEATQLAQYGQVQGHGSEDAYAMNQYAERLTEVDPETGKSAMQAAGMDVLMYGGEVDAQSDEILAMNAETLVNTASMEPGIYSLVGDILNHANNLASALTVCNYVKGGLAIAEAVATSVLAVMTAGQGGILAHIALGIVQKPIEFAISTTISIVAPIVAEYLIKKIGTNLLKDAATEWTGVDLGNLLASRSNTLLSATGQTGGQTPGSTAYVSAFKNKQAAVIAQEAEYQRATRSPFDLSSRYTFLGSLAYAAMPLAYSSSASGILKSLGNITRNSLTPLLPTASAIADTNLVGQAAPGDCPTLDTLGIQGDIFCNPLYIEDASTLNASGSSMSPEEIFKWELDNGYIVKNGSSYALNDDKKPNGLQRFMVYCGQRVSNWGIADANISSAIKSEKPSMGLLSAIPIIGNILTVADVIGDEKAKPWTTGSACVASEDNPYWNGPKEYNKMHQAFIAADRWLENAELTETTVTARALEDYYEEHPLDNSYEGILARYSGMSKEEVIATLDFMEALDYIANYHPEERRSIEELQSTFASAEELPAPTLSKLTSRIEKLIKPLLPDREPKVLFARQQTITMA